MTPNRTLEQRRASHALKSIKSMNDRDTGHYTSYVSSLPATIITNGLGQALSMLETKDESAHKLLLKHITDWLKLRISELGSRASVVDSLMQSDQKIYLEAQYEALAYLSWLKQFARAYIKEPEKK